MAIKEGQIKKKENKNVGVVLKCISWKWLFKVAPSDSGMMGVRDVLVRDAL